MKKITLENGKVIEISDESYKALAKGIVPEYKRWRAERDGGYYYIGYYGDPNYSFDGHFVGDDHRYNTGNYHQTKEQAEHANKVALANQRLKDAAEGFEPDWEDGEQFKYFINCNHQENPVFWVDWYCLSKTLNVTYYASEEQAQHVIDTMEDDLRLVLGL